MSVDIKMVGTDITGTYGGATLIGVVTKGINFNGEILDMTDEDSSGWQSLAAVHGLKSLEFPISGPLKNLELIGLYFGTSQAVEIVWTFPEGSVITADGVLSNLTASGDANTPYTWDATFASSGVPVYVAGT